MSFKNNVKIIFHIDLNMFFCSVAVIKNPQLKGKAFAIGRENTTRGVISTASYEARKFGIKSAMPISDALKLKKDLIIIEADYKLIGEYHRKFVGLIKEYTKLVEVASIDEVYADMTLISETRHPMDIANEIQQRLVKEFHLPCSIGIAPTLFLAKMASDMKKPLGLVVLRKRDKEELLYPLHVKEIYGLGQKSWPKLVNVGIDTIGKLLNPQNKDIVINQIGENSYNHIVDCVNGNSSNVVDPNRYDKNESISQCQTYDNYLVSETDILIELRKMTKELLYKIKNKNWMTKTVTLTLRNKEFKTFTRSKTIDYTDDFYDVFDVVCDLLESNYKGEEIRLCGVGLSNLKDKDEVMALEWNLFTFETIIEKEEKVNSLIKEFQEKYGANIIDFGFKK